MRLEPTITFEQYRATLAAVASAKSKKSHRRSGRHYLILAMVCLAVGLAAQSHATRIPILSVLFAFILLSLLARPWTRRSRGKCLRRVYEEEQSRLNDQVLTIDESGISCNQSNGKAVSHVTWQAFAYSIDMPDAFLFLPSPNTFVRVPKETLTQSERDLIRQWSSGIPPSTGD